MNKALAKYGAQIVANQLGWPEIAELTGLSEYKARKLRMLANVPTSRPLDVPDEVSEQLAEQSRFFYDGLDAELEKRRDRFAARDTATILTEQKQAAEIRRLKTEIEALAKELREAGTRQEVMEALAQPVPKIVGSKRTGKGRAEAAAVVVISDVHCEATVEPASVNFSNAFDQTICTERFHRLIRGVQSLVDIHRSKAEIRTLIVGLIGDVLENWIHEELMVTNSLAPLEAVRFAKGLLIHTFDSFLADSGYETIQVVCQVGNHGRLTAKKAPGIAIVTSLEWMLYVQLSEHYKDNERIAFDIPAGLVTYTEIWDYTLRWEHGDAFRSQGGVGGLTIPLNKLLLRRDQDRPATMSHLGHWHTYTPSMKSVVNGSVKGYDPYALSMGLPFERAAQAFYILDRENGVHSHAPLWLQLKSDSFGKKAA